MDEEKFIEISDDMVLEYLKKINDFYIFLSSIDDFTNINEIDYKNIIDKLRIFYINICLDFLQKRSEKEKQFLKILKYVCNSDFSLINIELLSPIGFYKIYEEYGESFCSNSIYSNYYYNHQLILDKMKGNEEIINIFKTDNLSKFQELEIEDFEETVYIPHLCMYDSFIDNNNSYLIQYKSAAAFFGACEIFRYIESKCSYNEDFLIQCSVIGNDVEIFQNVLSIIEENSEKYYELAVYSHAHNILEYYNNFLKNINYMNQIKLAHVDITAVYEYFSDQINFEITNISFKCKDELREQRWKLIFDENISIFK